MSHTFYDGTIVVLQGILRTLSHLLQQAEQQPNGSTLLDARLHEDMYPMTDQVRLTTQWSENVAARLTGREPVTFDRDLGTFSKCQERIETVLNTLNAVDKDVVNSQADVVSMTQLGPEMKAPMSGSAYAHVAALPNIYFHLTTAYGILRKEGVPLGKRDYYTGFFPKPADSQ